MDSQLIYIHMAHVPDQFRRFLLDLSNYQTQFNENDHQYLKDAGRRLTNGAKAGPAEQLAIQSYKKLVKGKEISVQGHSRSTSTMSEVEHLLELSTMRKELRRRCCTVGELALQFERLNRSEASDKLATRLKVERNLDKANKRTQDHAI